ncbi:MAG: queuosine precursor transporter [Alphaproteobacteria bacterium]|nr:queuosine precursor transporter [Alphaproteobacteria bacterium]
MMLFTLFVSASVCSTIVFGKFIELNFFDLLKFSTPAGTLIYPFSFLISDIITELYGKVKARRIVPASILANCFVVFALWTIDSIPATSFSLISQDDFHKVFVLSGSAFFCSSVAFFISQRLDITIFHAIKVLTKSRILWLRNNVSTIVAQIVDTTVFFGLIYMLGVASFEAITQIYFSTLFLKIILAVIETPLFYLGVFFLKDKTNKENEIDDCSLPNLEFVK